MNGSNRKLVYIVKVDEGDGMTVPFSVKNFENNIDNHKNIVYYVPSTLIHTRKGAIYGVFRKYTNLSTGCGRD